MSKKDHKDDLIDTQKNLIDFLETQVEKQKEVVAMADKVIAQSDRCIKGRDKTIFLLRDLVKINKDIVAWQDMEIKSKNALVIALSILCIIQSIIFFII